MEIKHRQKFRHYLEYFSLWFQNRWQHHINCFIWSGQLNKIMGDYISSVESLDKYGGWRGQEAEKTFEGGTFALGRATV